MISEVFQRQETKFHAHYRKEVSTKFVNVSMSGDIHILYIYIYIYIYIYVFTYIYIYMHIHTHMCLYVCIYIYIHTSCLSNTASCVLCCFRRVKDHHNLLYGSPLLKKICVRHVVLDKRFLLKYAAILYHVILCHIIPQCTYMM